MAPVRTETMTAALELLNDNDAQKPLLTYNGVHHVLLYAIIPIISDGTNDGGSKQSLWQ